MTAHPSSPPPPDQQQKQADDDLNERSDLVDPSSAAGDDATNHRLQAPVDGGSGAGLSIKTKRHITREVAMRVANGILSALECALLVPASMLTVGMGAWGLALAWVHYYYADVVEDTPDCQDATILSLLTWFCALSIASAALTLVGQCCKVAESALCGIQCLPSVCTACARIVLWLASTGLLIALCMLLWDSQCTSFDYHQSRSFMLMTVFAITQVVVHIVVAVASTCLAVVFAFSGIIATVVASSLGFVIVRELDKRSSTLRV